MRIRPKEKYKNAQGLEIPSVTTALNELNKPALVRWANKLGLDGIDASKYKDELADVGTLTHYFIMCRLTEEVPVVDEYTNEQIQLAQACYKQYVDWELRNPIRCIIAETPMISEVYQFGGTPDLYCLSSKDLMLVDFKTNAKGVFPEMIYQVAAYYHLLVEQGYKVTKCVILRLGRGSNEGAEERILTPHEIETGFEIFVRCLDIWRLKHGDDFLCTSLNAKP